MKTIRTPHAASHKWAWLLGLGAIAAVLIIGARYCVNHYVDFPVYWHASNSLLNGRQDLYDPTFVWGGTDALMDYRYPPLFLLMFTPLGMLPYTAAGYVWFGLKIVALVLTVRSIHRMAGKSVKNNVLFWSIPFLISAPYVVEDLHYGNVHFFIVFLSVFALYLFEAGKETLSASVLALSIAIKVFPIFFLPYFLIQRKIRYVALTLLFIVVFNLLPGFYFGFKQNAELLQTWYDRVILNSGLHEFHGGINHSLKGVLERYLSHIPYEGRLTDPGYPNINLANLGSESLQTIWYVATGVAVLLILFLYFRQQEGLENRLLSYGLCACAIVAFAPSTGYNYLTILILPSAVISAYWIRHREEGTTRLILGMMAVAALLSFLPPWIPGSSMQRQVQVHSPYFFSVLALFTGLAVALARRRDQYR
jgi:Glycosyltransferase family 87